MVDGHQGVILAAISKPHDNDPKFVLLEPQGAQQLVLGSCEIVAVSSHSEEFEQRGPLHDQRLATDLGNRALSVPSRALVAIDKPIDEFQLIPPVQRAPAFDNDSGALEKRRTNRFVSHAFQQLPFFLKPLLHDVVPGRPRFSLRDEVFVIIETIVRSSLNVRARAHGDEKDETSAECGECAPTFPPRLKLCLQLRN